MLIGGLASAGGSVASGIMGSNAAQKAAAAQEAAAQKAANFQQQQSQQALGIQQNQWDTTQNEMQPWLQSGTGALSNLNYLMGVTPQSASGTPASSLSAASPNLQSIIPPVASSSYTPPTTPPTGTQIARPGRLGPNMHATPLSGGVPASNLRINPNPVGENGAIPISSATSVASQFSAPASTASASPANPAAGGGFGSLMQPYGQTFTAPTAAEMEASDPGYQARMNLGQQAMEQSAAARGNLLTGGTAQAENQLAQDYASNEYNNFYNQALGQYTTNYNAYNQGQANQFNRLAALSGMGQQAAGQLGSLGQDNANAQSQNLLSTGQMVGNDYTNAGNANASGIVGSANAYGGMAQGIGNSISGMMNLSMLQNMLGGGGNGAGILNMAQNQNLGLSPYDPSLTEMIS